MLRTERVSGAGRVGERIAMVSSKPFAELHYRGLVYMTAPTIPFPHAFTTRWGGVSQGALENLNLGENRGDSEENVRENYRRVFAALGLPEQEACFTKQVHKNAVRRVTDTDRRALFTPFSYEADGVVTDVRGLPLFCFTADCAPLLLCDPVAGAAGAVHCGWRSTVADIAGEAVSGMRALGARPEDLRAAIGPAIGFCCFETGPEVPEAIKGLLGADSEGVFFALGDTGRFMVDLKETNRRRLLRLGLRPENISVRDECTVSCSDKYWSHRKTGGERGSQAALIAVP
jgi:YfiH family protein